MKIAVLGAGPAGLISSIISARNNNEVDVYEGNSDIGKKLLLTGNGKCNYSNRIQDLSKYHSRNKELIKYIINEDNLKKVANFYQSIGIISKEKNTCLYPFSQKAMSIKSCLITEARNLNVNFIYNKKITNIEYNKDTFIINNTYYDKVIIATGAKSYPKTGSDGSGYLIAKSFNHSLVDVNPTLMPLISDLGCEKYWAGKRCEAIVKHYEEDSFVKEEYGEIQFTNYGLSGICIFNLSRDIRLGLNNNKKESIHINFVPWLEEDIIMFLDKRNKLLDNRTISELCDGFIDYSLFNILLKYIHVDKDKNWGNLNKAEQIKVGKVLTDFVVPIIDTKTYTEALTCSGGIPLTEIDLETMESLKQKGLFYAGEIIDLDGDCGGYNLTIAALTGILAGDNHD